MPDWLIALIGGGALMLASQILSFVLLRQANAARDAAVSRGDAREKDLIKVRDELTADRDHYRESDQIRHDNEQKLLTEIAALKTERSQLAAKLAAAETSVDDLARILEDHPGTVADAFRVATIRLRQQLSATPEAASSAATRDPGGREGGGVHDGPDALEHP